MSGSSAAEAIERLYDRVEIEQAIYTWAHCVDRGDPGAAMTYFADDCVVSYGEASKGDLHGQEAYRAFMAESFSSTPVSEESIHGLRVKLCMHHVGQIQIDFSSSDLARASWYSLGMTERLDGKRGIGWSRFVDTFERKSDRWQIVDRRRSSIGRQKLGVPIPRLA